MNHVRLNKVALIVADFADPSVNELMPTLYKLIFSGVEFDDVQTLYEEVFDRVPLSLVNDTWFLENVSSTTKTTFDMLKRIADNTLSNSGAKEVFRSMWAEGGDADVIIEAKGLKQVSDAGAIEALVDEIIAANPGQVTDYRSGKDKLFGFFVGLAMKASKGKANPAQLNEVLKRKLDGE